MKVSVLGAGAIGSMLGGLLARDATDVEVVLIARGEHGRVLAERGTIILDTPAGRDEVPVASSSDVAAIAGSQFVLVARQVAGYRVCGRRGRRPLGRRHDRLDPERHQRRSAGPVRRAATTCHGDDRDEHGARRAGATSACNWAARPFLVLQAATKLPPA